MPLGGSLPVFNDGVGGCVVWVVVWSSSAGLNKQLSVVDGRYGLYLHVDPLPHIIQQRVRTGIHHSLEAAAVEELKLVGERAEAFLPHGDVAPVSGEAQCHVSSLGVLAVELHLQQVFPGDEGVDIVDGGDLILEE